jgi:hypothetical protein
MHPERKQVWDKEMNSTTGLHISGFSLAIGSAAVILCNLE